MYVCMYIVYNIQHDIQYEIYIYIYKESETEREREGEGWGLGFADPLFVSYLHSNNFKHLKGTRSITPQSPVHFYS